MAVARRRAMRRACPEVRVLRSTLATPHLRDRAMRRLARRYADGRRCAQDVTQALASLDSFNRRDECSRLLTAALVAVRPAPTVLWTWACAHADALDAEAREAMRRLAASLRGRHARVLQSFDPEWVEL